MAVANQPSPTAFQVGDTVFFIENNVPAYGEVSKTITDITDTDSNNTAEVITRYQLVGKGTVLYNEDKLFSDGEALIAYFSDLVYAF